VADYIFTMIRASKFYGADRKVLEDIKLASCRAPRSVCWARTAPARSTLLRIMAGREEPSSVRAELAAGATVGLLEQEPELDPTRDVRGNVEHGIRRLRQLLTRFDEISAAFSEPDADFDALIVEQAAARTSFARQPSRGCVIRLSLPSPARDV
jgi:ATPase subunit of ABC transporter with duplicated ATPase domains